VKFARFSAGFGIALMVTAVSIMPVGPGLKRSCVCS
jgi:hypothetical protein